MPCARSLAVALSRALRCSCHRSGEIRVLARAGNKGFCLEQFETSRKFPPLPAYSALTRPTPPPTPTRQRRRLHSSSAFRRSRPSVMIPTLAFAAGAALSKVSSMRRGAPEVGSPEELHQRAEARVFEKFSVIN